MTYQADPSIAPLPTRLSELASHLESEGARLVGDGQAVVHGLSEDSRRSRPGSLFVARSGDRVDGRAFVPAARAAGAVAVLCESGSGIDVEPRIEVQHLRRAWGRAAQRLWGDPSRGLSVVGITGTNGKTTCAALLAQALELLDHRTARLGTLGFFLGDELVEDSLTTPQPDQLARALAVCRARRVDVAVLEVSSHALDQERVAGVQFEVAAFTNLSQDHLDYHGTMERYAAAKAKLFREYAPGFRVFNLDDAWGRQLYEELGGFGVSLQSADADLRLAELALDVRGLEAQAIGRQGSTPLRSPLIGRYNASNLVVVLGVLLELGFALPEAAQALSRVVSAPGRLERCEQPEDDIAVLVDYAHTPDALAQSLDAVRALGPTEVCCVFGCGGDRDRSKRPLMATAVAERADRVFLTSDNPRSENPQRILDDARPGLEGVSIEVVEQVDRALAIETAVLTTRPGGIVLVAGKGHETYQLVGDEVRHFDDREQARLALAKRRKAQP